MPADPRDSTVLGHPDDEPDPRWTEVLRSLSEGAAAERHADFADMVLERLQRSRDDDRYEVEDEIARGGQGTVLRVWDGSLHRKLAMKVMLPGRVFAEGQRLSARELGRFLEEAQITGQLDHPGIVPVHELGLDEDGRPYFTMKLVKGESLASVFDKVMEGEEGWTRTRALGVLLRVCEAMAYAHSKGVTHRDLKPSNIMVGRFGEVYVMDWGLARVEDAPSVWDAEPEEDTSTSFLRSEELRGEGDSPSIGKTTDGRIIGTAWYMSPEQARGHRDGIGPHCDTYAIGAILYELLTGDPPYFDEGADRPTAAVVSSILMGPPTPVHYLSPNISGDLIAICEKAMAPRVEDRYEAVMLVAEDLRAYLEAPPTRNLSRLRKDAVERVRKVHSRNAALLVAGVLTALALIALSFIWKNRADMRAYSEEKIRLETEEKLARASARLEELETIEARAEGIQARLDQALVDEAYETLQRAADVDEHWPPRKTERSRDSDWVEAASRPYRDRLKDFVGDEEARLALASVAIEAGDTDAAIGLLEEDIEVAGAQRLTLLGHMLWKEGDHHGASRAYEAALKEQPNDIELRFDLGRVYLAKGATGSAVRIFAVVLGQWPESNEARRYLARAYIQGEQWGEAEAVLKKLLQREPRRAEDLALLGEVQVELGRNIAAFRSLSEALLLRDGSLDRERRYALQRVVARLLFAEHRWQDGLQALERSFPEADALDRDAVVQMLDEKLLESIIADELALTNDARLELGAVCYAQGLYESATSMYRAAMEKLRYVDPRDGHGFRAAAAAVRVAEDRSGGSELLHEQALEWLTREFEAWNDEVEGNDVEPDVVRLALLRWRASETLRDLRDADGLWEEVDGLLERLGR